MKKKAAKKKQRENLHSWMSLKIAKEELSSNASYVVRGKKKEEKRI